MVRRRARRARIVAAARASRRPAPAPQIWDIPVRPEAPVEREALLAELAATLHVGGPVWLRPARTSPGWG